MKKKALRGLPAFLLLLSFGVANAADSGFYVGGSVGQATLELPPDPDFAFEESDTAWKLLAGYNWDLGTFNVGIEAGYTYLGEPGVGDSTAFVEYELGGFNAFGVAGFALGPIDLYAKAGFIAWDSEVTIGGSEVPPEFQFSDTVTGSDFGYGIGANWNLGKLGIRAEYEGYDLPDTDTVYMLSIGLLYRF
jgi:opacity protein-like surface antigen